MNLHPLPVPAQPPLPHNHARYDALGRTTSVTEQDGSTVTTSYSGNTTTVTDEAGKKRQSTTDALGRLTQVVEDPGGLGYVTSYSYDTLDDLTNVTQANSRQRAFSYDSLSHLLSTTNPESGTVTYTYDANGNLASKTAPAPNQTASAIIATDYLYDALNRVTSKTYSDHSHPVAYFFDGQTPPATTPSPGTATVVINGFEQSQSTNVCDTSCDPSCMLRSCFTRVTIYDSGTISTTVNGFTKNVSYDQGSTASSVATAIANAFNADSASPVTASVSSNVVTLTAKTGGSASNYSLSSATTNCDSADFTHPSFTPSGFGFTLTGGCNTNGSITVTNGIGRRTGMCDSAGAEAWTYDTMGRVVSDQRNTNGITKAISYTYNLDGSLYQLTYPTGRVITYTPGGAGRMLSAVDSANTINYATNAHYTPSGALAALTNGASLSSTFIFNPRLQPCWMYVTTGTPLPWNTTNCAATAATGNVLDLKYNFNLGSSNNGDVMAITNNRDNTRSQNFTYDALNRLATAQTQTAGVTIPNSNCWGLTFGYDPWGNLLSGSTTGPAACGEPLPLNVTVTTANRISGYCYDSSGNLLDQTTCPANPPHAYTYNAENQLTSAGGVTYSYDGDGRRVQKSSGTLYWYGMGSDPLDETDLTGSLTNSGFHEYIFFNGKRIARRDSSNNVNYYFADHLTTARVVTDSSGTILDDSDFYPFGGERPITSSSGNNYKFTGKERDSESGLDNFGARYNSSSMGRFMSPDWSASPTPVPYASLPYPQSLNMYSYVQNNPLKFTDPTGHCVVDGEKHGWLWCAGHSLGFTETKKETAAREKSEAEWRAFVRTHPEYRVDNILQFAAVTAVTMGAIVQADPPGGGGDSTATPEENAAIDAEAAAGAEAGAARTMVNGVPQPNANGEIVVGPNGTAIKIPAGWVAEPAANGNGIVYRAPGTTGNANIIRVMGADARQPARVIIYNSSGQPIVPSTGRTGTAAETHTPL